MIMENRIPQINEAKSGTAAGDAIVPFLQLFGRRRRIDNNEYKLHIRDSGPCQKKGNAPEQGEGRKEEEQGAGIKEQGAGGEKIWVVQARPILESILN